MVEGGSVMLEATKTKTADEIACLKQAFAITDASWAAARGALRVGARDLDASAAAIAAAYAAGADEVVRSDQGWKDEAKELSGGGVDLVIDPVGGDRFTDSVRSLAEGGRVVVVGFTAGSIPEIKVNRLLLNNVELIGAGWGAYVMAKPDVNREIGAEIDRLIGTGHVRPIIGARFPLEQAADEAGPAAGAEADGRRSGGRHDQHFRHLSLPS